MIKGTGKRMVPERDIKYLEDLKANHSDPTASWGGTEVVANPTPGLDDPALTGLQVGDNKYKVPEVINVVANPTLAGTEDSLTGLQVGDTKYKITQGKLYTHLVVVTDANFGTKVGIMLETNSSTPFTLTTFKAYITSITNGNNDILIPCAGANMTYMYVGLKYLNSDVALQRVSYDGNIEHNNLYSLISDTVTEKTL